MNLKLVSLFLFLGIFAYLARIEDHPKKRPGDILTTVESNDFSIFVFWKLPDGKPDCATVAYGDLPSFVKNLNNYSFKIPPGKENELWRCASWSTRNSLKFDVQDTAGDRQRIRVRSSGEFGVNRWYWASDHEVLPEMNRSFIGPPLFGPFVNAALLTGVIFLILSAIERTWKKSVL